MSSPSENQEARHYNPKFRRKRRFQGATWTPGTVSAEVQDGVWCRFHKMRHGYKSKELGVTYEKGSNSHFKALWFCKETGTVLTEMELGNVRQG